MARRIAIIVGCLVGAYALAVGTVFVLMLQPPLVFGKAISKIPSPVVFMLIPFKQLWFAARGGKLGPGDPAPDFNLETVERRSRVQLSGFRGQKPVVLVFGSYT